MPRTAVTVTTVQPYQAGTVLTATTGDTANGISINLSSAPKLVLIIRNGGANTADITFELASGKNAYNRSLSISKSITTGVRAYILDIPPDLRQSDNVLHIDSADADWNSVQLFAYTWIDTPVR